MKKITLSIAMVGVIALSFSGCGAKPEVEESVFDNTCKIENVDAPSWVCVPHFEDAFAGVGIAEKSNAGMAHMRKVAYANGRSDLAQQVQTQVKDKMELFTRSTGVAERETIEQVNTAVSKQVAKVDLAGSKSVGLWTAPSGALYMLVKVNKDSVNNEINKAVKSSFKNDDALWQQFQSKNALEGLEKEFPTN